MIIYIWSKKFLSDAGFDKNRLHIYIYIYIALFFNVGPRRVYIDMFFFIDGKCTFFLLQTRRRPMRASGGCLVVRYA